jgi:hypothetical protein
LRRLRELRVRMLEEAADAGIDLIATWPCILIY